MVGHCINENCNRPLHALAEGRLFQFEVVSISLAVRDERAAPFDEKPQRKTVHFWLCGSCASTFTLVLEPARGLRLVSLGECDSRMPERHASSLDAMPAREC
jgi:hypothetical protein